MEFASSHLQPDRYRDNEDFMTLLYFYGFCCIFYWRFLAHGDWHKLSSNGIQTGVATNVIDYISRKPRMPV